MNLTALSDDFSLNAEGFDKTDITVVEGPVYLTDPSGNRLTDPSGNYLIGYYLVTHKMISLQANAEDLNLNAE